MAKIIGNITATPNPRPDWLQTDSSKADYIKNKPTAATEINENSTNGEYAGAKAVYDLVKSSGGIKTVENPKIWELESGLYRVQGGFYHSNEKEINDLINGEISATIPNQSTADYEAIDHEMFLLVYKKLPDVENTICRFTVFGDDTDSYSGTITMSLLSFEDNMYEIYSGNLVSITKTNEVNENSTNEQYPSAKAVYDLVKNEKLAIVTNPNLYELSQGWYIVQTGFYYNNDNSQYQKINDRLTMLVEQGDYETRICYGYVRGVLKYMVVMTPNSTSNAVFEYTVRGEIITSDSTHYETPTTKAVYDFVRDQIKSLIDSAPEALDTLKELADALNNDEDFASTMTTEISKKIDKTSIKTEIDENSTDENIASSKAIYEFINKAMENSQGIKVVVNPKIWELEPGLYRVQKGFYHSNEKEINDKINNNPSTEAPGQTTEDYKNIGSHEMLLLVYKESSVTAKPNAICDFLVFGDGTYTYSGEIWMDMPMIGEDTYIAYHSNLLILSKTNLIDEDSTDEQYPSAKAVYDYVITKIEENICVTPEILDTLVTRTELEESNEAIIDYVHEHIGDISDMITDKMTEEGLDGTNKVELPTARAINDYVEDKLANYTTDAVPNTRTINGKVLSEDIVIDYSDVGADQSGTAQTKANEALKSAKEYTDNLTAQKSQVQIIIWEADD